MKTFDIIVIGAGPAGVSAALRAASQGANVCIVEQDRIGAACFRKGLYPYKAAIAALNDNSLDVNTNGVIDIKKLWGSVEKTMASITRQWETRLIELGVNIQLGRGVPLSSTIIQVECGKNVSQIHTKKTILATGSHPVSNATIPFEKDIIISADDIFQSKTIPNSVFIMGCRGNECEIAYLYRRLGSKVFLSSDNERLFPGQDPDIIEAAENALKKLKVKLLLDKKPTSYFKNDKQIDITLSGGVKFQVEKIIQSLDREGSSINFGCETVGVRLGEGKEVLVNERLETSVEDIFAVGSLTGRKTTPLISEEEGRIAADNAMGKNRNLNIDFIPLLVFSKPEMACVGCYAKDAHVKGFRAVEGKVKLENLDFGLINNKPSGFFKIAADVRNGVVIGGQIVSPNASHLILLVLLAIKKGMKVGALASLVSDKSGESQGIKEAASACSTALKELQKSLQVG